MIEHGVRLSLKLVSILAVAILLMTGLQVAVGNVAAAGASDEIFDHIEQPLIKRLTMSSNEALCPAATSSASGTIALAWIDVADSGAMTVRWKCSYDNGTTFSSDRTLTPAFYIISSVNIACTDDGQGIAIVFTGTFEANGLSDTYLLASSDGGSNWTQTTYVSDGSITAVAMHGSNVYLGVFGVVGNTSTFSIVCVSMDEGSFTGSIALCTIACPNGEAKLQADDGGLHYALLIGPDNMNLAYGRIGYDGIPLIQPTVIYGLQFGNINGFDLCSSEGDAIVAFTTAMGSSSAVYYGHGFNAYGAGMFTEVERSASDYGDVSLITDANCAYMAWGSAKDGQGEISYAEVDINGDVVHAPEITLTAQDVDAPSLIRSSPEIINCVWSQAFGSSREVFLKKDLAFGQPDLIRLIDWVDGKNPILFNGEETQQSIIASLTDIAYDFLNQNPSKAHDIIADLRDSLEGTGDSPLTLNILAIGSDFVSETLESNLAYYASQDSVSFETYTGASVSVMADNPSIYDITASYNPTTNTAIISWWTTFSQSSSNYVYFGKDSHLHEQVTASGTPTFHSGTIPSNELHSNQWYYYQVRSGSTSSSVLQFYTGFSISALNIAPSFTAAFLSWQTNAGSTCNFNYGMDTTCSSTATVTSSSDGMTHSASLSALSNGTTYYYKITATSNSNPSTNDIETGSFVTNDLLISIISSQAGLSTVSLVWSTSLSTTCTLDYGPTLSLGQSVTTSSTTDRLTHHANLTGLSEGTEYYYRIGADYTGAPAYHKDHDGTFQTPVIVLLNVSATSPDTAVKPNTLEFSWETNREATTQVRIGTSSSNLNMWYNGSIGMHHFVRVENLQALTTYYYALTSSLIADSTKMGQASGSIKTNLIYGVNAITTALDPQHHHLTEVRVSWYTTISGASPNQIYFGPSGESIRARNEGTFHYCEVSGYDSEDLVPNTTYPFRVVSSYNDVQYSSQTHYVCVGVNIFDVTVEATTRSATINWTTNLPCLCFLDYGGTPSCGSTTSVITLNQCHYTALIDGLTPTSQYYFRITARFIQFDISNTSDGSFVTMDFGIENLVAIPSADSLSISWETNKEATTVVYYGTSPNDLNLVVSGSPGTYHVLCLPNLSSDITYYYKAVSVSMINTSVSDEVSGYAKTQDYAVFSVQHTVLDNKSVVVTWSTNFDGSSIVKIGSSYYCYGLSGRVHSVYLGPFSGDSDCRYNVYSVPTLAPQLTITDDVRYTVQFSLMITSVTYTVQSTNSVLITWITDYPSTSEVEARSGHDTHYDINYFNATNVKEHTALISGLQQNRDYTFTLLSDWYGTSTETSFSLNIPTIAFSGVSAVNVQFNSATLTWTTNLDATTVVQYAACTLAEADAVWANHAYLTVSGSGGTAHSLTLIGLNSNTDYTFKVYSAWTSASCINATSSYGAFFTGMRIMNVAASSSNGVVTVTWTTPIASDSTVYYGLTSSYGSVVTGNSGTTAHSVSFTVASSATTYHFKVRSSVDGVYCENQDNTFVSDSITISSITVTHLSPSSVIITWTTDYDSNAVINYGLTTGYGSSVPGTIGKSHSATISGLSPNTLYYYKLTSQSSSNAADVAASGDLTFTTPYNNDNGLGRDAGGLTSSIQIVLGSFQGQLSSGDSEDAYGIYLIVGQRIQVTLTNPSGFDYDLYLYNPSSTSKASSCVRASGGTEHLEFTADSAGKWIIDVKSYTGPSFAAYSLSVAMVSGSLDRFSLQVSSASSGDTLSHLQGISTLSGWGSVSGSMRHGSSGATLLFNIYASTYQMNEDFLLTFTYYSTSSITVSMYNGAGWVDIGILPGKTQTVAATVILPANGLYDSQPGTLGMNVQLRLSAPLDLYWVDAVSYSYEGVLGPTSGYNSGVATESGWTADGGIFNGSAGATLIVTVPRTDIQYLLQLNYLDSLDGMQVQQQTGSLSWTTLGTLRRWGDAAVILLSTAYYDSLAGNVGTNVRLKIASPLYNLSSILMSPARAATDMGASGDANAANHLLGLSILDDGSWSSPATLDGRTVRNSTSTNAAFLLDAPRTDDGYEVRVTYRSSQSGSFQVWNGASYVTVASITGDNQWREAVFNLNPSHYYDSLSNGEMNVKLKVSVSGVSVDSASASVDSDGDGLSDAYESNRVGNQYTLDPFSSDTDNDNLKDDAELATGTNPAIPDTDGDGLLDGNEAWSQTWSVEEMYQLTGGNGAQGQNIIYLNTPQLINRANAPITDVKIFFGIAHSNMANVKISLWCNNKYTLFVDRYQGSGTYLCRDYDLFTRGYGVSDVTSPAAWALFIDDWSSGGGQLQYFRIEVSGRTNPLDYDTDDDGISDGEEVNLGEDGWVTNPISTDTDHDYVSDYNEIHGSTLCDEPLDPTRADTDGDGCNDNVDYKLGNMLLKVSVDWVSRPSSSSWGNVFFVIKVDGNNYVTPKTDMPSPSTTYYPNLVYYFDVPDSYSSTSVLIQAWNEGLWSDSQLRFNGGSNCEAPVYNFGGADAYAWYGTDVNVKMTFSTVTRQMSNLVVVSGVDDDQSYGLEQYGSEYRYTADEQMFVMYINCISGSATTHFVSGVNTVLVPRSVALSSDMNYTFTDLMHRRTGTIFNGYDINVLSGGYDTSGSIVMIVTANLTTTQAEILLSEITSAHDHSIVGESTRVSGDAVYRLHLPLDALDAIVVNDLTNSPLRDHAPTGFLEGIVYVIVYGFVFGVIDFFAKLVTFAVELGLRMIGELIRLTQVASNAISSAITAAVEVFDATVAWAIDEIKRIAQAIIVAAISSLIEAMDTFYNTVKAASLKIIQDIVNIGAASLSAINGMVNAFTGDMLMMIVALSIAINTAFYLVQGMTIGAGFLMSIVISTIAGIVIQNIMGMALGNYDSTNPEDDTHGVLTDWLESIFLSSGMSQSALDTVVGYLDQFWCVMEMIPAMIVAEAGGWKSVRGLAVTFFSIVLGFYAIGDHDARLTALAMILSGMGIVDSFLFEGIAILDKYAQLTVKIIGGFGIIWFASNLIMTVI
jgi:hypothetical protein